jgi:hypothetical protein
LKRGRILEERVTARSITTDPNVGIPDLIRRLTYDSKRLATDEVRLARIEAGEALHRATRGTLWMTLAFGAGTVISVSLTMLLVILIGRAAHGHMWIGALGTGFLELGVGGYLLKRGLATAAAPSYSLEQSRRALTDTAHWAGSLQRH